MERARQGETDSWALVPAPLLGADLAVLGDPLATGMGRVSNGGISSSLKDHPSS